jgi:hypothetical protein
LLLLETRNALFARGFCGGTLVDPITIAINARGRDIHHAFRSQRIEKAVKFLAFRASDRRDR